MLADLIFDRARLTPGQTAVIYNGARISYRAFADFICLARGYFAKQNCAGPGCAILAVSNRMGFWVHSLALRSLGLTTIAVRSALVAERLDLPTVRCVVTDAADLSDLRTWCDSRGVELLQPSLNDGNPLGPSEARCEMGGHILLTSGTTGRYKMVLMTPAMDAVYLRRKVELVEMDEHTILCAFDFPPWTAAGYRATAAPWFAGGAVVIEQRGDISRALLCPGITHGVIVPTMLQQILATPQDAFPRQDRMQLAVAAGAMTTDQFEQAKARITPHLFNYLASTEAAGIGYTPLHTAEDRRWHRLAPGRVVEVVDEADRPLPNGEVGRVRIDTEGGPMEYFGDPTATQTFFKNGYFYPGDLAVMRHDGYLALQGRVTDVINVQGSKLPPAPIEERLKEFLGVSDVCLFSRQAENGEERVHIVIEASAPVPQDRMSAAIARELHAFRGAYVHYVEAFPRNDLGKVVRETLRNQPWITNPQH